MRVVDFFYGDPTTMPVERAHEGGALVSWQVGDAEQKASRPEQPSTKATTQPASRSPTPNSPPSPSPATTGTPDWNYTITPSVATNFLAVP